MKKLNLLLLGLALIFSLSCSKKNESVEIDEQNLTACEGQIPCKYVVTEKADIGNNPFEVKTGSYRLFSLQVDNATFQTRLYIKAPMGTQQFTLNDKDIKNGKAQYYMSCTSCDYVAYKVVGGYAKGKNLNLAQPSNQSKWLIEAKIELEAIADSKVKQTLFVKQYFMPKP